VALFADRDLDGMADAWEQQNGFDPSSAADQALDADGDGLTNLTEFRLQTAPAQPRHRRRRQSTTARSAEVSTRCAPTRTATASDDGAENGRSDPLRADTDGDGVGDAAEVTRGTDPKRSDTDTDSIADALEIRLGSDPRSAIWETADGARGRESFESGKCRPAGKTAKALPPAGTWWSAAPTEATSSAVNRSCRSRSPRSNGPTISTPAAWSSTRVQKRRTRAKRSCCLCMWTALSRPARCPRSGRD